MTQSINSASDSWAIAARGFRLRVSGRYTKKEGTKVYDRDEIARAAQWLREKCTAPEVTRFAREGVM
jgi:hypothetical protein